MLVLDTNVLLYAANAADPAHAASKAVVEHARSSRSPWCLTWGILYEFLRVVTHPRVFSDPWPIKHAWRYVGALIASPRLQVLVETPRHHEVVADLVKELPFLSGNLLHDAHTAALMREYGIKRIYTRDTDFHRFPFLEVIDPLAAKPEA